MAKHRKFNADRFLDRFQGQEHLIRAYVRKFEKVKLDVADLDVPRFKEFLVRDESEGKDELVEGLYQAFDLCTDHGHEALIAVCQEWPGFDPDADGSLPVECLSLKVRTENEDAFDFAYARNTLWQAERFTIVRGKSARPIADPAAAAERLREKLATIFKIDKKSERVIIRHYTEGNRTNFVIYHERHTKAELTFAGTKARLKVAPTVLRPAQQDFVSYDRTTGQVEIETRFEKEEASIRSAFAECCLDDATFFDDGDAASRIDFSRIAAPGFELRVRPRDKAALVALRFSLPQAFEPAFEIRSKNVLATLDNNHLRPHLAAGRIQRATFKIVFPDDARGKRVELSGTNSVKFNRATHADEVFAYLADWNVLR